MLTPLLTADLLSVLQIMIYNYEPNCTITVLHMTNNLTVADTFFLR